MKILGGKKQKDTDNITQDKDLKQIKQEKIQEIKNEKSRLSLKEKRGKQAGSALQDAQPP